MEWNNLTEFRLLPYVTNYGIRKRKYLFERFKFKLKTLYELLPFLSFKWNNLNMMHICHRSEWIFWNQNIFFQICIISWCAHHEIVPYITPFPPKTELTEGNVSWDGHLPFVGIKEILRFFSENWTLSPLDYNLFIY